MRRRMRPSLGCVAGVWKWARCVLVVVAVAAFLWAVYPVLFRALAAWLDVGDRPHQVEYVMVLAGGENTRPFAAAALVKAGVARRGLLARIAPTPDVLDRLVPPPHEINRRVLQSRGIAENDVVLLPGAAATTYAEARALAALLDNHPRSSVLVVTNDFHTRRTRWIFSRALGRRAAQATFVSAPTDEFPMDDWWRSRVGFQTIVGEHLKLAFYAARYGCLGEWLAACAAFALAVRLARRRAHRIAARLAANIDQAPGSGTAMAS